MGVLGFVGRNSAPTSWVRLVAFFALLHVQGRPEKEAKAIAAKKGNQSDLHARNVLKSAAPQSKKAPHFWLHPFALCPRFCEAVPQRKVFRVAFKFVRVFKILRS